MKTPATFLCVILGMVAKPHSVAWADLSAASSYSDAAWTGVNPGIPGVNGKVHAAVYDNSGSLYIGGEFTFAGNVFAQNVARWNGSVWTALGTGTDGPVHALTLRGNELYVGGVFQAAGGVATSNIAKWSGSDWSALGSGLSGGINPNTGTQESVHTLAISGNNLYAGGNFMTAGGVSVNHMARWNGVAWSAFGHGMPTRVNAILGEGTVLYVASSEDRTGVVAKWDGLTWTELKRFSGPVYALAMMGTDLFVGGQSSEGAGTPNDLSYLAKWDGIGWSAVGDGPNYIVTALAVSGTDLYAGGQFSQVGGQATSLVAKWNGSTWSALGSGSAILIGQGVEALAVNSTDLYVGGQFSSAGGKAAMNIAQWSSPEWKSLGSGMDGKVNALAVIGTDLYIGGEFHAVGGVVANYVAKWNGSVWSAVGTENLGPIYALAVIGTDLYAGGLRTISKWDGSTWSTLGPGLHTAVYCLMVEGTNLYAGGAIYDTENGEEPGFGTAKWDGTSWQFLGTRLDSSTWALAAVGGKVYAGGDGIEQWNGNEWSGVGSGISQGAGGFDGEIEALLGVGSDLYLGGYFAMAGGVPVRNIAKWNGSVWSALGAGLPEVPANLTCIGNDLYTVGKTISKWDGSKWSVLSAGVTSATEGGSGWVAAVAVMGDEIFVGGNFTSVGGIVSPYLAKAKLFNGPAAPPSQIHKAGQGPANLTFYGKALVDYQIQRSQDLLSWTTMATVKADGSGHVPFADASPPAGKAFYRISLP